MGDITHDKDEIRDAVGTIVHTIHKGYGYFDVSGKVTAGTFRNLRDMGYSVTGVVDLYKTDPNYSGGDTRIWIEQIDDSEDNEELSEFARNHLLDMLNGETDADTKNAILSVFGTLGYNVERKYTLD